MVRVFVADHCQQVAFSRVVGYVSAESGAGVTAFEEGCFAREIESSFRFLATVAFQAMGGEDGVNFFAEESEVIRSWGRACGRRG